LWHDLWQGQILWHAFLELFYFVNDPNISVPKCSADPSRSHCLSPALSVEAFAQFQEFSSIVLDLQETPDSDVWTYIWGSLPSFPLASLTNNLLGTDRYIYSLSMALEKKLARRKGKYFFFWLLLKDRLNTRD